MTEEFDLERFVTAQEPVFDTVLSELRAGRKRSHWMWFVFPQLRGLGRSSMAEYYGIGSLAEARAYLAHTVLGPRSSSAGTVVDVKAPSLHAIFGSPDDMKFRSCATLFAVAAGESENPFQRALDRWCDGQKDERTLAPFTALDSSFQSAIRLETSAHASFGIWRKSTPILPPASANSPTGLRRWSTKAISGGHR